MIHTSLSPNTEADDLWLALKSLLSPWSWKQGEEVAHLEEVFQTYLGSAHAISFQRGRDALLVLLQALGIGHDDEVILQAYTCIVVPNAISYAGAKPVYADLENIGFNIDPLGIEKLMSKRTKAVIVQHTFGVPVDLPVIQALCKKHNLILIEDCAHALSASFKGSKLGTFGHASIFSFGRDKTISSVWGGMVATNDPTLAGKLREVQNQLPLPSSFQIVQALLHPLLFALIKPIYRFRVGRGLVKAFQKIRLLPLVIFSEEKQGRKPDFMPQKMPAVLAKLSLHQLHKLDRFHGHRKTIAKLYSEGLKGFSGLELPSPHPDDDPAWLRFTIRSSQAAKILEAAKNKGIFLGDWYRTVLAPPVDESLFGYEKGSCPRAEKAATESVNLPTHIQMTDKQVQEIINFICCVSPPSSNPAFFSQH